MFLYVSVSVCMFVCVCFSECGYMWAYVCVCEFGYVCVCMFVSVSVCMLFCVGFSELVGIYVVMF